MKRTFIALFFIFIILGLFVIGMNLYAYGKLDDPINGESETLVCGVDSCELQNSTGSGGSGIIEEIGISEKVDVTVERNRWYGKIIENKWSNGRNLDNLYLFTKLRMPLNVNGTSLIWIYILVPSILIFIWIIIFITDIVLLATTERRDQSEDEWIH